MKLVLLAGLLLASFLPACGQDVATCASICGTQDDGVGGSQTVDACVSGCTSRQTTCALAGQGATFQEYLTCVANAGGLSGESVLDPNAAPAAADCAKESAAVSRVCGI